MPASAPLLPLGLIGPRSRYADLIMATPGLVGYWRGRELSAPVALRNELGMGVATLTGAPTRDQASPVPGGASLTFNGSSQSASAPCNLTTYYTASISFWLNYTGAKANGHFIFEYCNSYDGFNNADKKGGFGIQTNDASTMRTGFATFAGTYTPWEDLFAYPSAGWHHFLCTYDRTNRVNAVYIDGVTQTLTASTHSVVTYPTFSNDTLYWMARNNASLRSAGGLTDVALFGGVLLTQGDAIDQYNAGITGLA